MSHITNWNAISVFQMSVIYNLIHTTFQQWSSGKCHTDFKRDIWFSGFWLSRQSQERRSSTCVGVLRECRSQFKPLYCVLYFGLYFLKTIAVAKASYKDNLRYKCYNGNICVCLNVKCVTFWGTNVRNLSMIQTPLKPVDK